MRGIKGRLADPRLSAALVAVGWGVMNAAATLVGIFQGVLVPSKTYAGGGGLVVSPLAFQSLNISPTMSFGIAQYSLDIGPVLGIPFGQLIFFLEILGIAVFASFLIADFQRSLLAFIFSYALGAFLVFFVLILPGFNGAVPFPDVLTQVAIFMTFVIFFPIPLFLGFGGSFLGVILSERFA
jgi:hypothetical protein